MLSRNVKAQYKKSISMFTTKDASQITADFVGYCSGSCCLLVCDNV